MLEQWYGIMPNKVLYSKELTDKQKLLYCLISSLCAEKWYCRATNEFIANKLWATDRTIREHISELQAKWFITVEFKNNNERFIRLADGEEENFQGGGRNLPGGEEENFHPYNIYTNITNIITVEKIFSSYYWKTKWIDEKRCTKLINDKLKQWITLEDIRISMVLYNTECRMKEFKYTRLFENRIVWVQKLTADDIEDTLTRLIRQHKERKKSDPKRWNRKPAKDLWKELWDTFWIDRINKIYRDEDTSTNILHFT